MVKVKLKELFLMNNPKPTATQIKQSNSADAYADIDRAFSQGTPLTTVLSNISSNGSGYASMGLNHNTYLDYAKDKYAASQDAYTANGPTYAERNANTLTNRVFKNRGTAPNTSNTLRGWLNDH
jgi:hypothetical protein